MKKYTMLNYFLLFTLISLAACSKKREATVAPVVNPVVPSATVTPTPGGTSSTTGSTNGGTADANCTGTTDDGDGSSPLHNPLIVFDLGLSGQVSWKPGFPAFRPEDASFLSATNSAACHDYNGGADCTAGASNNCYYCKRETTTSKTFQSIPFSHPIPLKKDVWSNFHNDGDVYVRIKIQDPSTENIRGVQGAYCYQRKPITSGPAAGNFSSYNVWFTKVRLTIVAWVLRKTTNCTLGVNCTENDFSYPGIYKTVATGLEISVNQCSPVIKLPSSLLINNANDVVVFEIKDVLTDAPCKMSPTTPNNCPFYTLNTANCWFASLEIATNETDFFKGQKRN